MRRSPIALALATALLLGLSAAPSIAAPKNQTVGDRLDLRDGDQTYAASTPFHINHGFVNEVGDRALGLSDFVLDMDGVVLPADFVQWFPARDSGLTVGKLWFYNFPAGLTGTHTFTRHYFQACINDTVPCAGNSLGEIATISAIVTFSP